MKKFMAGFLKYLYIITTIFFLIAAGVAMSMLLIGVVSKSSHYSLDSIVRDKFNLPPSQSKQHEQAKAVSDTVQNLGNEFHKTNKKVEKDSWSFCVDCHGTYDHAKKKEARSFLNMHSQFISCEVCHVSMQSPDDPSSQMGFGWVDLKEGKLVPNPDLIESSWGDYGAKIAQVAGDKSNPAPFVLEDEKNFYLQLKSSSTKPDPSQEEENNKVLHQNMLKEALSCTKCHNSKNNFFPYVELGYSEQRKSFLVTSEVVDLINNLEKFFIPSLMKSGLDKEENAPRANP